MFIFLYHLLNNSLVQTFSVGNCEMRDWKLRSDQTGWGLMSILDPENSWLIKKSTKSTWPRNILAENEHNRSVTSLK